MEPGTKRSQARGAIPALELLVEVLSGPADADAEEHFYSHLAEAVCRLADMRRAIIFRYDDASRRVRVAGAHGIDPAAFSHTHISVEVAPLAATALAEDRVIEVLPGEEHFVAPEFVELVGDRPLVYVPIAAANRWPGVMLVEPNPEVTPLDDARKDLLWTLGKTLALAAMARIATFHGERARQLEDRIDLARDIHDRVIQRLFGVSLVLTRPLDDQARERAGEEIQTALSELRSALQRPLGRPSRETGTTLAAELQRLSVEHADLGLRVEGAVPEVPTALEPLAQSVLTEAVRNVRKHAVASEIAVRVRREDEVFVLEVFNDGVTGQRAPGAPGMGLRLAALEAIHVGGVVEFGPRPNGRWQVRLAVPLEATP
ncbi:GAF domain-containing sensor histidine kinase [Baekduia alba]|uniref:GAF domain-containing sensor histidine kinase n=1 Tax=Baekduia alba TaxID=2997333 RepID=UPI002341FBD7|nr:GAF domain-containing protein [Baekduia alba]